MKGNQPMEHRSTNHEAPQSESYSNINIGN